MGLKDCLCNREGKDLADFYLSPWKAFQGFLECTLHLSIVYERMGNVQLAERFLKTGRKMSMSHNFPLFQVTFSTMLGIVIDFTFIFNFYFF